MLLAGCSETPPPPPDTSAADQKAIKDGEIAWASDWASKDVDKLVSHYADTASVLMPDSPIMTGKDAIRAGLKNIVADKNLLVSITTVATELSKGGDLAYTQGTYSMTMTNPKTKKPMTDKGKFLTVYMKQADGTWKVTADTFNSDSAM